MKSEIILGDCLEVMRGYPDKSFDLVLTDPPYGMDYRSSWRTEKYEKIAGDASLEWIKPFLNEAFRVLKDNSHIYLFCNDYAISDFRKELEMAGFIPKRAMVWVKNNHTSGDLEGDYGNKTEFILFAHKGRRELNGKRETNVLEFSRQATELHPTQKPVELMKFFIEKSTDIGGVILDPFGGSCTTLIAAEELGRKCICIEMEERYVKIGKERFDSMTRQIF